MLHITQEVRDIPIVHHIRFALGAHLPGGFDAGFGFALLQVVGGATKTSATIRSRAIAARWRRLGPRAIGVS
jgi:hypothetical protein